MLDILVNGSRSISLEHTDETWTIDGNTANWSLEKLPGGLLSILHNGKSYTGYVETIDRKAKQMTLNINGSSFSIAIKEPIDAMLGKMGIDLSAGKKAEPLKSPMPGLILKILVEEGQEIEKGTPLLILEAMKMENVLKASGPATVKAVKAIPGSAVEKGAVLIEMM